MNDKLARVSPVSRVTLASPLFWLIRGWRDFVRHPLPGLLHGLSVTLFGALLYAVAEQQFGLLVGAFSGFLLVAPVLATGLYAVSRELERDRLMSLAELVALWRGRDSRLVGFGLLLCLAGTAWVPLANQRPPGVLALRRLYPTRFRHPWGWGDRRRRR